MAGARWEGRVMRQEGRGEVQWEAQLYSAVTGPLEFILSKVSERLSKRMRTSGVDYLVQECSMQRVSECKAPEVVR